MPEELLLHTVPASKTWEKELDFVSEWLSDETNMERLGKLAGLELVSGEIEARTNHGNADMLCREEKHDANVVIEAQFGYCDMDHIGRLLEYAVDLKAAHCVMVAEKMAYAVLELYSNFGFWRANCNLHLVEYSVLEADDGEMAGVLMRKPTIGLLAKGKTLPALVDVPISASADVIDKEVVEALRDRYPPPRKLVAGGAKASCKGKVAELPKRGHRAKGCISVAFWPSTADESFMASTLAHASRVSAGVLLVLLPRCSERVCQLISCMQAIAGAKLMVTAQRWKWQASKSGKVAEAVFSPIELDEGDTKAAQAMRDSKRRRDFWHELAKAVKKGSLGSLDVSTAKNASSWQLGYQLGRSGFNLTTSFSENDDRYLVELRIHGAEAGLVINWFEQLQAYQRVIEIALESDFEFHWSNRGLLRRREAVLRCIWRRRVAPGEAYSLQDVPELAQAVQMVERTLLRPIQNIEEFAW